MTSVQQTALTSLTNDLRDMESAVEQALSDGEEALGSLPYVVYNKALNDSIDVLNKLVARLEIGVRQTIGGQGDGK